ncbi:hypothetical protein D3C81_1877750 [compost metagenome]
MKEVPDIPVNLAVLLLNADKRSLLKPDISAQQRKKMCFFLHGMLLQRIGKLQDRLAQLLKPCPALIQTDIFLFKPKYDSVPFFH